MKHFTDGQTGETPEQEREALMADIVHLREQCVRYGCEDGSSELGGVQGLMLREKTRLLTLLQSM
jgi:hypothetical protein